MLIISYCAIASSIQCHIHDCELTCLQHKASTKAISAQILSLFSSSLILRHCKHLCMKGGGVGSKALVYKIYTTIIIH